MKIKESIKFFLITLLCVGIVSVPCVAEGHGKGKRDDKGHGLEKKFFHKLELVKANDKKLGLSDAQFDKIKMLELNTRKDVVIKSAEIEVLKIEIKLKLWEDTIDKTSINKLIDKKYEFKKAKAKVLVSAYAQFKNILTPEQKKMLKAIIRKHHR
jgi:Spy/CpxP family protein refolding chaperone